MAKKPPPPTDFSLQSTRVGFNIPKIKKVKSTALLNSVPLSDRNSTELIREVDRTCIDRELKFKKRWKVNTVHLISPPTAVELRYREKRAELKDHGGGRLLQEVLGFFVCKDKGLATKIAREGVRVNRYQNGCLGDPSQGVYLFRYLDVALLSQRDSGNVYVMVFKVLLGRTKQVPVSDSGGAMGAGKEPTPNFDAHVSQFAPNPSEPVHAIINKSQMYVYEYTDEAVPTECPRQCLPYALIEFTNCSMGRKDGTAHAASPKSISSSAANAGWTSVRRPSSEGIRKAAFEPHRPFAKETLSFVHPPVHPVTPPLTPNDAESLCSPQGRETLLSPGKGGSHGDEHEFTAWSVPEERRDNHEHVNTDRPHTEQVAVPPSHPGSLDFKEMRFWPMMGGSGYESGSDNTQAGVAAACRDPDARRFSGEPYLRQLEVDGLEESFGMGRGEHQSSSSAPAQNVLATVNRLWGRTNSTPAEHSTSHAQVEPDPMDSWGLTWNGNDDESVKNQKVHSSQAQMFHHERCSTQRYTNVRSSEQENTLAKSLFERRYSEPSSSLLSDRDLAFLCESGDAPSVKKNPPVHLLNRTPIKSALKKTVPTPLHPSADSKKKKMSYEDYIRKKKAGEKTEMNVPATAVNKDGSEAGTSLPNETTGGGACPSTKLVCASHSPISVFEAESGSSVHFCNSSHSSFWGSHSVGTEAAEVQTTTGYGQTSTAHSVCSSIPLPTAVHQFAVNFKKALGRDPRLHSKLRALNSSPRGMEKGAGASEAGDAAVSNKDVAGENPLNRKSVSDQLASICQESLAEVGSATHGEALGSALPENHLTEQGSVEVNTASKPAESANHQVLFADIPDDFDNENALCVSLEEHSQDTLSEVGETDSIRAADSDKVKNADGAEEMKKSESADNDVQEQDTPIIQVNHLSVAEPNTESLNASNASEKTAKQVASATESLLLPCVPTVEQVTSSGECEEDATQLLRIAKGLRGKPAQATTEETIKSRNVSPCSDTSSRKSRNVSPCSDSSACTSSLSCAHSSKESTPDLFKSKLLQFSSAASTETDESDRSTAGQRRPAGSGIGTVKNKKSKGKPKREGSSIDVNALEPNVDPYALVRLSKGLRPGKSIHVGGLGKNPTDDPLPVLGDDRRKRKNGTKVEKGGQQTAAKKEKSSLQQGQATEQKVQKRRRNAGSVCKRRSKKKCTSQANPRPPIDDDIDYTDFQFDEPQEFCVSICDDIDPAGDRSSNPIIVKEEPAEGAPSCDGGQALPLSYLGLSHWTEALVQPRLDPQVTLVDLFKAYSGLEDFENCAICRKVIDLSLVEGDDQVEEDELSSTEKLRSVESRDPASEQSKNCLSSASPSFSEAAVVSAGKGTGQSETSAEHGGKEPSSEKCLDKMLPSPTPVLPETKQKNDTDSKHNSTQSGSALVHGIMDLPPACSSSVEHATAETVEPVPSGLALVQTRDPSSERNLDTSLSSSSEPATTETEMENDAEQLLPKSAVTETKVANKIADSGLSVPHQRNRDPSLEKGPLEMSLSFELATTEAEKESGTGQLLSESAMAETKKADRVADGGMSVFELRNRDPSCERSSVQTLSSSSEPATAKRLKEKESRKENLQLGDAAVPNRELGEDNSSSASVSEAAIVQKKMQSAETSSEEAGLVVQSKVLSSVVREERDAVAKECSELSIQKDLCKTISVNEQSLSSAAELNSLDAATAETTASPGVPKRSCSAAAAELPEQKCQQSGVCRSSTSKCNASHRGPVLDVVPTLRGTCPRPSFTVCSQGSTKQRWQHWKALRMQGKAVSDIEGSPQRRSSVPGVVIDSEPCPLSDVGNESEEGTRSETGGNEIGNCRNSCENLSCASENDTEVLSCTTPGGSNSTENGSDLHSQTQDMSSSNSGQNTIQEKAWQESGFWLGINELKTLHSPAEDSETCVDTQEICSLSAVKISPTKLSRLITVKEALAEVEDGRPTCFLEQGEGSVPVQPQIAQVEEGGGPKTFVVENTAEVLHTDSTKFFEMVIGETNISEVSSKSVIPGLDLVDHSKPQETVDTGGAMTNDKSLNPNKGLPNVLEIAQRAVKELFVPQYNVEDESLAVSSKFGSSAGEHFKEVPQEADLKKQTRDIVYSGEDLDILGTPNLDSNRFDTRKKRLTIVCKSVERKTRSSNEVIAEMDCCGDTSERNDGHTQQGDSSKREQNETVKVDCSQILKERGITGCPIPSFTSTRNNQKNKDKKAKNKQDGSELASASRPDSSNDAESDRSGCADMTQSQGTEPAFHTNLRQPAAPGIDTPGPENMGGGQFGHNVPHSQMSHVFAVGQPLYQQPMLVGPMLVPNASVQVPNAPMHMMNAVNTSMPMAVPMPMLSSVHMGVPPPDHHFMVYSRQPVPFSRPMVPPLFTAPPPPLPGAMLMQPPPPGTMMQKEALSPIDSNSRPCPVTVACHQNGDQEISKSSSVHVTGPSMSSVTSKSSSQSFTQIADSRSDARCNGDFSVLDMFTDREVPAKNPPKKDMIDWFSDILDGKRNASSLSELEPESKKARLDFVESSSQKRSRWDMEEKLRETANSVKRKASPCDSEEKPKRESASSRNKKISPCSAEDKTRGKKQKENTEKRISFRVGFSSDAVTKRCGPLRKSVNLDSDSDSDGPVKRIDRGTHRQHEKSRRESGNGRTPVTEASCKATDHVRDSKVSTEKETTVTKSSRSLSEKKKGLDSRHGFESDRGGSKKAFSKWNKTETDSENLESQLRDVDDEMKGYAHALLDTDVNVASLEMISNKISLSIAESLSSPNDLSASDIPASSKNQSHATEDRSSDQKDSSSCEHPQTSLTDKPLEFLYFAKEILMKKLKEEGSGPANSPTEPDQSDLMCSGESVASAGSSFASLPQQQTETVHLDHRLSTACVEAGGQARTTDNAPELDQNKTRSSSLPVTLTASSLSAITEEEMAKLKDIVLSCLPVASPDPEHCDAGRKSSQSEKGNTVVQTADDHDNLKKDFTSGEKNKNQAVKRPRKPSSSGRDWSRFLTSSRPAFRTFVSGGRERKNYYGDFLDTPVSIDKIVPQAEGFHAPAATSTSRSDLQVIRTDFNTERKPQPQTDAATAAGVDQKKSSTLKDSQHGIARFSLQPSCQPQTTTTTALPQAGYAPRSVSATQTFLTRVSSATSSKPVTQVDSVSAETAPIQAAFTAASKPFIKADSAAPQRSPTPTNSTSLTKSSSQCGFFANEKNLTQTVAEAATSLMPSTDAVSSVAPKHSVPATQTGSLTITTAAQIEMIPGSTSQMNDVAQQIKTTSKKGHAEEPKPSTSTDSNKTSNPSTQQGATAQPRGSESNTRQEAGVNTVRDFLFALFPDVDPEELAPLLTFKLTYDIARISNKEKKNIVICVRKYLENQNKNFPTAPAVAPAVSLEDFAVSQIEIELGLVEGTLKLLEATRVIETTTPPVQSKSGEVQTGPSGQRIVEHSSPSNADIVRGALTAVVKDFNNAVNDASRGGKGRPHQRLPGEVLLCDEQDKLYTKEGAFVMLVVTIPSKPYARMVQMRRDIEACLNKIGHAACGNRTDVVMQERRRLEQLQFQRLQLMKSFTGAVNSNRLQKIRSHRDHYATCLDHLLRVLGIGNVTKMVFFKAFYEAVQNHLEILEREMG